MDLRYRVNVFFYVVVVSFRLQVVHTFSSRSFLLEVRGVRNRSYHIKIPSSNEPVDIVTRTLMKW